MFLARAHSARQALRQRLGAERGTVIVFIAAILVALMSSAAYTIDLATARQSEQRAQVAADAGALAAADDASVDANREASDATTMAQLNDPGAAITFSGASERAQVGVSAQSHNDFASVAHATSTPVSASATARSVGSENQGAIFASDTSCSTSSPPIDIEQNGDNSTASDPSYIDGSIDSNGAVQITNNSDLWLYNGTSTTASNNTTIPAFNDSVTYGGSCASPDLSSNTSSKTKAITPMARATAVATPPVNYLNEPYNVNTGCATTQSGTWPNCSGPGTPCTDWWKGNQSFSVTPNTNQAFSATGVFCIDGEATFSGYQDFSGKVTIIAMGINVNQVQYITASPDYNNDLFFYCTAANNATAPSGTTAPNGGYTCSMQTNVFSGGTIFAPYNTLQINSTKDLDLHGYLEAKDVQIISNGGLEITGNGPSVQGSTALTN